LRKHWEVREELSKSFPETKEGIQEASRKVFADSGTFWSFESF
jgi:hypothetical protein